MKNIMKKIEFGKYASLAILIGMTVVFQIMTHGRLLTLSNSISILNQAILVSLVSTGAAFLFGIGNLDLSLGSCVCLSSVLAGMGMIATGSMLVGALISIGVSLVIGLVKGFVSAVVEVPYFIFSIVLSSVFSAFVLVILGNETTRQLSNAVKEIPSFNDNKMAVIELVVLVLYVVVCAVIFHLFGMGIKVKMYGGNKVAATQVGIHVAKMKMFCFFITSIGVGLASYLTLIRTRTVGYTTASGMGNDVLVALVLGGMPVSGGTKTKISAGVIGALTVTILNSGLSIMRTGNGMVQIIRGLAFVIVVFLSLIGNRERLLPRK